MCSRKIVKPRAAAPWVSYLRGVTGESGVPPCGEHFRSPPSVPEHPEPRTALRLRIRDIAKPASVMYRKIRVLLKREGWNVGGKKLVYRWYRRGFTKEALRYKPRQTFAATNRRTMPANAPNQAGVWISSRTVG